MDLSWYSFKFSYIFEELAKVLFKHSLLQAPEAYLYMVVSALMVFLSILSALFHNHRTA